MLDLLFVLASIGFFAGSILYIYGCDWFIKEDNSRASLERIETSGDREQLTIGS